MSPCDETNYAQVHLFRCCLELNKTNTQALLHCLQYFASFMPLGLLCLAVEAFGTGNGMLFLSNNIIVCYCITRLLHDVFFLLLAFLSFGC
jgi:hypothetical protein